MPCDTSLAMEFIRQHGCAARSAQASPESSGTKRTGSSSVVAQFARPVRTNRHNVCSPIRPRPTASGASTRPQGRGLVFDNRIRETGKYYKHLRVSG